MRGAPEDNVARSDRPTPEQVARLVRAGEWTTYGDIAAVAFGSLRRARMVGRAAATSDDFPHAHRVLTSTGTVSRGPSASERRCAGAREKLESEGVAFSGKRADPARRVHWDELARRAGSSPRNT
jgi:alkylated DNA nucleotide flippase Atl1